MCPDRIPFYHLPEEERRTRYERLARKALAAYAMEDAPLSFLAEGRNVTYQVRTGGEQFALRICDAGRERGELLPELLWLVALRRDTRLVVPEPLLATDGEILRSVSVPGVPGFHPCVLFSWVDGERPSDEPTPEQMRALGRFTAALHQHGRTHRLAGGWRRSSETLDAAVPDRIPVPHDTGVDVDVFRAAIPRIRASMNALGSGADAIGSIHGNLHPPNVLFSGDEARAIAFAACHSGYYVYDLATICDALAGKETFSELRAALLQGYESLHPLPSNLDRHLPAFAALRTIDTVRRVLEVDRLRTEHWVPRFLRRAASKIEGYVTSAS